MELLEATTSIGESDRIDTSQNEIVDGEAVDRQLVGAAGPSKRFVIVVLCMSRKFNWKDRNFVI